jgi:hypothetical protein
MNQVDKMEFQQNWNKAKTILIVLGVLILAAYLIKGCEAEHKLAQPETMNKALGDSLKTWRDKEGDYIANFTLLENENADYFTKWNTTDSTVIKLQALVAKYKKQLDKKGSATVITTAVSYTHLTLPTNVP